MAEGARFCPRCGAAQESAAEPFAAGSGTPTAVAKTDDNVMAALAYLLIPAIVFLVAEPHKSNRFIRFHSFQSLLFCAASIGLHLVLGILSSALAVVGIGFLIALLIPFVSLALFVVWILLVVKAFQGEEYRLPYIGDIAAQQV